MDVEQSYKDFTKLIQVLLSIDRQYRSELNMDPFDPAYGNIMHNSPQLEVKQVFGSIYYLLDIYLDALSHGFKEVNTGTHMLMLKKI